MPESRIIRNGHAFLLEIDGKKLPLYGYMSYQPAKARYRDFQNIGVHKMKIMKLTSRTLCAVLKFVGFKKQIIAAF